MPVINCKKIIGMTVETKSGEQLGKVFDFEVEIESQNILKYYVKSSNILEEFFKKELIIHRNQIISISNKKIIVKDGIVHEKSQMANQPVTV
ncbi:MAG: PRC-barrel domain-containing protein [Patescibacteria group bacterium]|nr:PRC-barrel domain-containing protein [Patescibacteria group bacterium]